MGSCGVDTEDFSLRGQDGQKVQPTYVPRFYVKYMRPKPSTLLLRSRPRRAMFGKETSTVYGSPHDSLPPMF